MVKKIFGLLESYVQWGALALGVAFLGYMIWMYLFANPASKPLSVNGANETVTPANVDHVIADGPAAALQAAMARQGTIDVPVDAPAPLDVAPPATQPVVAKAWDSWGEDISKSVTGTGDNQRGQIAALPRIPALHYLDQEPLRTVLQVPDPNGGSPGKKDQDSVTTFWSLPLTDLATAYGTAFNGKLAQIDQDALFAHADLVRQQLMPDGSWGFEQVVDRVGGTPPMPYPYAKNADFQSQASAYLTWLQTPKSPQTIVSADYPPVFYDVGARPDLQWKPLDAWVTDRAQLASGTATAGPQPATPAQTPAAVPDNNPFGPAPAPQPAPAPGPAGGGASPTGGRGTGPGHIAPGSMRTGTLIIGANPNGNYTITNPNGGGKTLNGQIQRSPAPAAPKPATPAPLSPPAAASPVTPPVAAAPIAPEKLPPLQPVPDSGFSPNGLAKDGDMELYFHDLTVEPGNTYRYKVRYSLFNPIFNKANYVVGHPDDARKFTIDSPDSPWSDSVVVPARTRFWCSSRQPDTQRRNAGQVDFTVFVWHDGKWNKKDYSAVSAGDEIGDEDFVTHVTLLGTADRPGAGEQPRLVLLVPDSGGPAEARNERSDATSADYQKFQKDFAAQTPADAPAGAAPAPAGGNPPVLPGQLPPGA